MLEIVSSYTTCIITYLLDCLMFGKVTESKNKILSTRNIALIILLVSISVFAEQNYSTSIKLIITNIQCCLLLKAIYNRPFEKIIIFALFLFLAWSISEIIFSIVIINILKISTYFLFETVIGMLCCQLIISLIFVSLFYIKPVERFIKWLCKFCNYQTKIGMYLMAVFIVISIAAITYPISGHIYSGRSATIFILFYLSSLIFIVGFFGQKSKNGELIKEYDSLLQYMSEYEKALDEKSKRQHEYRNQLVMIKDMVSGKNKKASQYIQELLNEEETKNIDLLNSLRFLPSGGIKGLIYYKAEKMIEEGMEVHVNIAKALEKKKVWKTCIEELQDISRVIGVYIDNAIEAARKAEKKYVIIDFEYEEEKLIISFSNTYKGHIQLEKLDKQGYSTKGKNRGYGLPLVKEIIEKNELLSQEREMNGMFYVQKLIIKNKKKT